VAKSTDSADGASDKPKTGPLSTDDFRSVLQQVHALGLTWTADAPPRLIAQKPGIENTTTLAAVQKLARSYPNFTEELGATIWYILTGSKSLASGQTKEDLEAKAAIVLESGLISDKYRSEFFFRFATKVPYFSDLDWEVVVKAYEKNVQEMPGVTYALVSLQFRNPIGVSSPPPHAVTIALDGHSVERLIKILTDVKNALGKSTDVAGVLRKQIARKAGASNAGGNGPERLGQAEDRPEQGT
jgi:hypothetical protein